MIVGIDNGLDGGLVALSRLAGLPPVDTLAMPTRRVNGSREIDPLAIVRWLEGLHHGGDGLVIGIEQPLPHARSADAARGMWFSFGLIAGALAAKGAWTVERIQCGNQLCGWQRGMLGNVPSGRSKEFALAAAQSLWPSQDWRATRRSTTPHSGIVDAALIAEFVRRRSHNNA